MSGEPAEVAPRSVAPLPLLGRSEARVVFAAVLFAAHLGEGLEPALRGRAGDSVVRAAGLAAGWASSFAALLVFFGLLFFVLRSIFAARASWARSALTGVTAAGCAFAITALVAGHAGPPSRVLLASLAAALFASASLTGPRAARRLSAFIVLAELAAHVLASRAFESGSVAFWVAARGVSTMTWAGLVAITLISVQRLATGARGVALVAFALAAALAATVAIGASAPDGGPGAFLHAALTRHAGLVPPFALGAVPYLLPSVARVIAWASLVALPVEALALPMMAALIPSLPAPLAALAVLFACHLEATGVDDDARARA